MNTYSKSADELKDTVTDAAHDVREEAKDTFDRAKSQFADLGRKAQRAADIGAERGKEFAAKASEKAGEARHGLEDQIRANPLAAVGIAVGVGILLASLTRRS